MDVLQKDPTLITKGMKVSFEIPTKAIMRLKKHQDYDFTLAHMALKDEMYRRAYGEGNVMDNGMYETGEPLKIPDLRRAATLIKPSSMISPDFPTEVDMTLEAHKICVKLFECEVAGVVVGKNLDEMINCYEKYLMLGTNIICLAFRSPRMELLKVLKERGELKVSDNQWYHFLGLKSIDELKEILDYNLPWCSIDTSKPVKAGLHGKTIHDDLRGLGHLDLDMDLTDEQCERVAFQMERFREICHGIS